MSAEPHDAPRAEALATDVREVLGPLVRRFRAESQLPVPQLQALSLLERLAPTTTSALAAHERIRPQSMAQTVANLVDDGLVLRTADPEDGRQQLLELTPAGRDAVARYRSAGERWIAERITERLTADEQAALSRGLRLLARLADD